MLAHPENRPDKDIVDKSFDIEKSFRNSFIRSGSPSSRKLFNLYLSTRLLCISVISLVIGKAKSSKMSDEFIGASLNGQSPIIPGYKVWIKKQCLKIL